MLGESYELVREKDTSSGGVGFSEDRDDSRLRSAAEYTFLDYLDNAGAVVKTRTSRVSTPSRCSPTTQQWSSSCSTTRRACDHQLQHRPWSQPLTESTLYPSTTEVKVPEGYTYVAPGELIDDVIKAQAADPSVDEIRIFLRLRHLIRLEALLPTPLQSRFRFSARLRAWTVGGSRYSQLVYLQRHI